MILDCIGSFQEMQEEHNSPYDEDENTQVHELCFACSRMINPPLFEAQVYCIQIWPN